MIINKVLLISYHYPPSPTVGSIRPSKFVKYLPMFGWDPYVLTISTPTQEIVSYATDQEKVWRTAELPHPLNLFKRFRKPIESDHWERPKDNSICFDPLRSIEDQIKRWLTALFCVPDQETGWIIPAVIKALCIIREQQIRSVLTSGPPYSCHIIGLILQRLSSVRWVADFRDPWLLEKPPFPRNGLTDAIERRLIELVIRRADCVVSVTPPMTERNKKLYPMLDAEKFVTVTNGFDASDFAGLRPARPKRHVVFSYVGSFYQGRTPEPFLRCLSALIESGTIKSDSVSVRLIGDVEFANGRSVAEIVESLHLEHVVTIEPPVCRYTALRRLLSSHVALVLDEYHSWALPMKLYDALAAGVTVFNIGSKGAVSELLARTGRGISADYRNMGEISDGIIKCLNEWKADKDTEAPWEDPSLTLFHFEHVTGKLAAVL